MLAQIATDAKIQRDHRRAEAELLSLKGTIVPVDALNCQRQIAQKIVDQGGDYALVLKGNQGTLHDDMSSAIFDDPDSKTITAKPDVAGDDGRIETRGATVSTDIKWLQDNHQWSGLVAIAKPDRIRDQDPNHQRDRLLP